jgi:hypothetical protein
MLDKSLSSLVIESIEKRDKSLRKSMLSRSFDLSDCATTTHECAPSTSITQLN